MEELLKTLVESEMLTEESKEEISTKLNEHVESMINEGIKTRSKIYREELKEQFAAEKSKLVGDLDRFLKNNLKGALAESIRDEYKTQFNIEQKKLVESLNAFLEVRLEEVKPLKESKSDLQAKAFLNMAKDFIIKESDVDDKTTETIHKLQVALKESKQETAKVYRKLAESNKKEEERILEGKVKETLRLIPEDKRTVAKRLLEGVELSKFDKHAKAVVDELVESVVSDKPKVKRSGHTGEVVTESTNEKKKEVTFDEFSYLAELGG